MPVALLNISLKAVHGAVNELMQSMTHNEAQIAGFREWTYLSTSISMEALLWT